LGAFADSRFYPSFCQSKPCYPMPRMQPGMGEWLFAMLRR
jgi:hypothetical protein